MAKQIRFRVLVWGPTPTAPIPLSEKRKQIREAIQDEGHEVRYSEDLGFPAGHVPTNTQELDQITSWADYVIDVGGSFGSQGEAHEFALMLARKLLLWLPREAETGFIGTGLARQLQAFRCPPVYFDDSDVRSCLMKLASADWIEDLRGAVWDLQRRQEGLNQALPERFMRL